MENVIRDSSGTLLVYKYVTDGDLPTAVTYVAVDALTGETLDSGNASDLGAGVYTVQIPSASSQYDREVRLDLTLIDVPSPTETVLKSAFYSLYTPYASVAQYRELYPNSTATDAEIILSERVARSRINNIIGYSLAKTYDVTESYGVGSDVLPLSTPILDVLTIHEDDQEVFKKNGSSTFDGFEISRNRLRLRKIGSGASTVNEFPWFTRGLFKKDVQYKVGGIYGYESIPSDLSTATLLVMNDSLCSSEDDLRHRGIVEYSNAAYEVKFGTSAVVSTGNSKADYLLSPYRRLGLRVV